MTVVALDRLVERSVDVIKGGQASSGAYLAAPTFEPYRYSWFRDGSFIADAMSRVGELDSAEAFFDWGARVILDRRDRIAAGEHLHARYTVDGYESTEDWPTLQHDGYGLWLWAVREHAERHGRSVEPWAEGATVVADYLARVWHVPCTDWWEERVGLHAATLACIDAGLSRWGHSGVVDRSRAAERIDASLLVLVPLELGNPADVIDRVEQHLVSPGGGVHRHREDTYYGGGEWLLLTAFLGWALATVGETDEAAEKLGWVAAHATREGDLPEQSQDHLLAPASYEPWVQKWGPPASPLLWSHAMSLTLAYALGEAP